MRSALPLTFQPVAIMGSRFVAELRSLRVQKLERAQSLPCGLQHACVSPVEGAECQQACGLWRSRIAWRCQGILPRNCSGHEDEDEEILQTVPR